MQAPAAYAAQTSLWQNPHCGGFWALGSFTEDEFAKEEQMEESGNPCLPLPPSNQSLTLGNPGSGFPNPRGTVPMCVFSTAWNSPQGMKLHSPKQNCS